MAALMGLVIWLIRKENKIMASQEEASAKLDAISVSLTKIGTESTALLAKISELQSAAQGNVPDDVMAKINAVAAQAQVVDDQVPDEPSQGS